MTSGTLISVVLCLALLTLKFLLARDRKRRTVRQRMRFLRLLLSGLLALAVVYFLLQRQIRAIDGESGQEPGMVERIVLKLSGR